MCPSQPDFSEAIQDNVQTLHAAPSKETSSKPVFIVLIKYKNSKPLDICPNIALAKDNSSQIPGPKEKFSELSIQARLLSLWTSWQQDRCGPRMWYQH